MIRFLPLFLLACAPTVEEPAADTGVELRLRADDGWSPCVGARPLGCGRCPEGQRALWRRLPDGSVEAACFDRETGEKVGTPSIRRPGRPVDDNGRPVEAL